VLRNVDLLCIHYYKGMEVLGKRLTKAVAESFLYAWAVAHRWQRT